MSDSLNDAPVHVWNSVSFGVYLITLSVISIVGMALGYPQALWVWAVYFFLGWDREECSCPDCVGREHPENKQSASDMLKREYVNNEITEEELDEKLDNITTIEQNKDEIDREIDKSFN
jgi:uncharacterized membrane protein